MLNPGAHIVQVVDRVLCAGTGKVALSIVEDQPEICTFAVTAYTAPVPELVAVTGTARHNVPFLIDTSDICPT